MQLTHRRSRLAWLSLALLILALVSVACVPSASTPPPATSAPPTTPPTATATQPAPSSDTGAQMGVDADGNFYRGNPNAAVKLMEFSDFQ